MNRLFKRFLKIITLFTVELALVWSVFLISFIVFALIVKAIFIENEHGLDNKAFEVLASITSPGLTKVMVFITFFGTKKFLLLGSMLFILLFMLFDKHRWYSIKMIVIALGSTLLNQLLKVVFERQRPVTQMLEMPGLSFPSGHAMIGLSFYGLLMYWVWSNIKDRFWRWFGIIALFIWSLLVGFSRIYLQVHYLSDVIAGFAAGALWLIVSISILRKLEQRYLRKLAQKNGLS
ncbi:MAG: phosphatase PAP2 family protein [Hymenobacteraceae bacterium]|nr:phosphatase PAP2 family protein [Hymenobacteraceae bacterium]